MNCYKDLSDEEKDQLVKDLKKKSAKAVNLWYSWGYAAGYEAGRKEGKQT